MIPSSSLPTAAEAAPASRAVGRGMARGAAWMVLMRVVVRGAGLINMMILARLLVPEDFGLIAMAMIFVGAVDILSEFNFDVALIQNQQANRTDYDTAWTLSVLRGAAVAALLVAIAGPAAAWFQEPRLEMAIIALSASPLLLGFQNIGVVDFRKSLNFRKDFILLASAKIVAVIVTVALAIIWRNHWALIGGMIASKVWRLAASYAMHPFRPRPSLARWRVLFGFTKWLLLHNVLLFFRNRADRLVIGKMLDAATLGVYSIAHDLANLVTTELMAPIRRALLPGYAKLAADPDGMRATFADVFGLTLWIGAPVAIGMGLVAEPLIGVLLGSGWADAVPIVQMLVMAGFVALLSSGSHPLYIALGRPELQVLIGGIGVLFLLPGMIIGVQTAGVLGAAAALVAVQALVAVADIVLALVLLKLNPAAIIRVTWRSLIALGGMTLGVGAVVDAWPAARGAAGDIMLLLSAVMAGMTCYLLGSFGLWLLSGGGPGPERHVWRLAYRAVARLRATPG